MAGSELTTSCDPTPELRGGLWHETLGCYRSAESVVDTN